MVIVQLSAGPFSGQQSLILNPNFRKIHSNLKLPRKEVMKTLMSKSILFKIAVIFTLHYTNIACTDIANAIALHEKSMIEYLCLGFLFFNVSAQV